ncbi:MAG TPA: cyanophycin synthetase [Sphingomonas sp.]
MNSAGAADITGLRVTERSIYRGPNLFGARPMIRVQIDLGALEESPSDRLPGFVDRLLTILPGLAAHGCSIRQAGGFERRLRQGTWLGHVIEHVALELQNLGGHAVTRGKTRSVRGRPGVYNILYAYLDEAVGLAAGAHAIALVAALLPPDRCRVAGLSLLKVTVADDPLDLAPVVASLRALAKASALGPTTQSLVEAARRRGIPVTRLNTASLIQLGHGRRQRRIRASVTGGTSLIGAELAGNKNAAKALLAEAGLPVPRGALVGSVEEAVREARRLGWPVVTKPLDGNHGRGVTTGIVDAAGVEHGFALAVQHGRRVIVERELPGRDHRILVIGGKVVAVAERVPARVFGDGIHSIDALIALANQDPRRGVGHEAVLTRIVPDAAMRALLEARGQTLATMPPAGAEVILRGTANLSTGGTAIDRTDEIHPETVAIAEQTAAVIGLDVAGIDFLTTDIARPARETGGGIVEINAAPGFRMHLEPSEGTPRDVATPVIDMLFPRGTRSRIPIFAITGTNGKSTTARMVARILREGGLTVGMTSTSGIYVDDNLLVAADSSGPKSARAVLRNPVVDVAVLETARGGILREGLGFPACDVGAVLNVTADHLGLKGIDTLEDLARVKAVVARSVARRGHCVLNADDPMTVAMARRTRGRVVWFSAKGLGPRLRAHVDVGGVAVVREAGERGGMLVVHRDGERTELIEAAAIPATLDGTAEFNIQNALAAAAMCIAHGVAANVVRQGLRAFTTSFADSPGRLNIHDDHGFRVIVDYAHNPAAITALGRLIDAMRPHHGRVYGMVSIPGDRRDDDLMEMGRLAASIFDEVMFREAPDGRGRPAGSINALMSEGAMAAGLPIDRLHRLKNEEAATDACLAAAAPGDLVVLMPTDVEGIWNRVVDYRPVRDRAQAAPRMPAALDA